MDEDEISFEIGENDEIDVTLYEPFVDLKGADDRHTGGIKVRNMGRIMKMSMFIQKKPPKNFIREFKKYGCHCWPKGG